MENHLDGLPKYGVTLSGSPLNPAIENHSGRTVIADVTDFDSSALVFRDTLRA
jgi:hypothetical protein